MFGMQRDEALQQSQGQRVTSQRIGLFGLAIEGLRIAFLNAGGAFRQSGGRRRLPGTSRKQYQKPADHPRYFFQAASFPLDTVTIAGLKRRS